MSAANAITADPKRKPVWEPIQVQFFHRHQNEGYYVRTYAGGKEKWTSLRTKLLSVAKNRIKDHTDAASGSATGNATEAAGQLHFGDAIKEYRKTLEESAIRPNTKSC